MKGQLDQNQRPLFHSVFIMIALGIKELQTPNSNFRPLQPEEGQCQFTREQSTWPICAKSMTSLHFHAKFRYVTESGEGAIIDRMIS